MWFKAIVDSLFWTVALQLFIFFLDLFTGTDFSRVTYTVFGFIVTYSFLMFTISNMRYTEAQSGAS